MPEIQLGHNQVTVELDAEQDIAEKEVVGAVGSSSVAPIDETEAQSVVGVADEGASAGESLDVVVLGKKKVIVDGAVGVGEPVRAAATAGRVISELENPASHNHSVEDHAHTVGSHSHDLPADTSETTLDAEIDSDGNLAVADGSGEIQSADLGDTEAGGPESTNDADPGIEHGRTFGKSLTSADAEGEEITVLVALTA